MSSRSLPSPWRPSPLPAGFSAIELMAAIAIAAILMAMAMPSFGTLIGRYRLRHAADDLSAAIYLARSEGLRRGGNVTLGRSAAQGCSSTGGDKDWSCGWLVFADADNDGAFDPGEERIQVWTTPQGVTATAILPNQSAHLSVNRWGRFQNLSAFRFEFGLASDQDKAAARVLCISSGGRLRNVDGDRC
ncbi:GspH/FimT family protein [Variovorax sp. J22R24]|uniref:GspH/FimT family protein n=1 Tax=Variovorax gracilis TaxID=3053502 RepID=UPI002576CD28|nr:GspH/FimT family protein [Variovorax sp. J22R24]MDM0103934.1 GspH/FimT family protein [Variovorax sp. J22R24]